MQGVTWRTVSGVLSSCLLTVVLTIQAVAGDPQKMVATGPDGVAIKGYDTVAYFTENRAVKGKAEFTHSWRDVEWRFDNAHHQQLFATDPERYAPQFGGFCALGLAKGKVVVADPEAWTIIDDKLYIKFNEDARDRWRADKTARIEQANENWAELEKQN